MADWTTISSLATAGGTLILAIATFSSTRSANRAARTAERAFAVGVRPVLFQSDLQDPIQKIRWGDGHWARLGGGRAVVEDVDGAIYLAMSLRNVGSGIAVLRAWTIATAPLLSSPTASAEEIQHGFELPRPDVESFRPQGRDLYVPAGGMSFWQAAIRRPDDPDRDGVLKTIGEGRPLAVALLYGDQEGGQRTISLFMLTQWSENDWACNVARHWYLDRDDPR